MSDLTGKILKLLDESDGDTLEKLTALKLLHIVVAEEHAVKNNLTAIEEMAIDEDADAAAQGSAAGLLVKRKKERENENG